MCIVATTDCLHKSLLYPIPERDKASVRGFRLVTRPPSRRYIYCGKTVTGFTLPRLGYGQSNCSGWGHWGVVADQIL